MTPSRNMRPWCGQSSTGVSENSDYGTATVENSGGHTRRLRPKASIRMELSCTKICYGRRRS